MKNKIKDAGNFAVPYYIAMHTTHTSVSRAQQQTEFAFFSSFTSVSRLRKNFEARKSASTSRVDKKCNRRVQSVTFIRHATVNK